jgi:hypothetical protein
MRTLHVAIAALLGAALLIPAPVLAQAPNLGPDWELKETRKVKVWIPFPDKPGSGKWELVDFNTYRMFQANLANPAPTKPALPAPDILFGPIQKGASYEEPGAIEPVRKGSLMHRYQTIATITPQSRVETTVHKDWKLSEFLRTETRSQTLKTKYGLHDISFLVPVTNYRWDVVELKRTNRDVSVDPLRSSRVVELLPPIRLGLGSLGAVAGNRSGLFTGDSGSGAAKPSLETAKVRTSMGANEVKATEVKASEAENDAAQFTIEELKLKYQHAFRQVVAEGDAELRTFQAEIAQLSDKQASAFAKELDDARQELKKLADKLDGKAMEQYAAAKKNALKLDAYRSVIEDVLDKLQEAYTSQQNALQLALSAAIEASRPAPVVVATPAPVVVAPSVPDVVSPQAPVPDAVAKILGSYRSSGGTTVTIARHGNSDNVKVDVTLNLGHQGAIASTSGKSGNWSLTTSKTVTTRTLFGTKQTTDSYQIQLKPDADGSLVISGKHVNSGQSFASFKAFKK